MNTDELIEFYNKNKNGKISLNHHWADNEFSISISLEFLYQVFKAVYEREKND